MTPEQITLVQESFKQVQPIAAQAADLFYGRLFEIAPQVRPLGRRHAGYKVTAEHYKPVGEALIWTLEQGLGDAFTPPIKTAWLEAYTMVANVMKEAAEAVAVTARPGLFARLFGRRAAA